MSRLASFRGPSTPFASPVSQAKYPTSSPSSPSRQAESPIHRQTRKYLQELQKITQTWDDIVCIDGAKAAKVLIDARTKLDNDLALLPPGMQPHSRIVGPQLNIMEKAIADLDAVLSKLQKQFRRLNTVVENLETLLFDAHKTKGWQWVHQEPMWVTWPMEKFVNSVSDILAPYHRSLNMHIEIVDSLRSHSVSFEESRESLSRWIAQPWLEEDGWEVKWEDLCEIEVERWDGG